MADRSVSSFLYSVQISSQIEEIRTGVTDQVLAADQIGPPKFFVDWSL